MPYVTRAGIALHYQEQHPDTQDTMATVVLLHGLGACLETWERQQPALVASGCRVIALDLRGHGRSAKPAGSYSIPLLAEDAAQVIQSLQAAPCVLVGHSLGGTVAYEVALRYPKRVRALIIINGFSEVILNRARLKLLYYFRLGIIQSLGVRVWGRILARQLFPGPEGRPLRAGFAELYRYNERGPYLAAMRALVGYSLRARLPTLQCPVLLISADQDYTSVDEKRRDLECLPHARLAVIAHSRHFSPWDQPLQLGALMKDFIVTELSRGGVNPHAADGG